jgi:iron complex transport system substrate-binding protein
MNPETIMKHKPDVALAWASQFVDQHKLEEAFKRIGVPVLFVHLDTYADWPAALEYVGVVLNSPKRGKLQAAYMRNAFRKVVNAVGDVPENLKPRVYYAEGLNGLMTDCNTSFHTEVIEIAGGHNVYRCKSKGHYGKESVSLEQILAFDPEVIIAQEPQFVEKVRNDARWQKVRAVRNGRIYTIPHWPFNWFDRPPSTMRALGIQWLTQILYPHRLHVDLRKECKTFYKLFLEKDLSEKEVDKLLGQAGNSPPI